VGSLDELFDQAERASPGARIDYRDSIASYGADGLPRLTAWLLDERLGLFAARTIEQVAKRELAAALQALGSNRDAMRETVRREVDAILERLQPARRPSAARQRKPREPRTWPNRRLGHAYGGTGSFRVLNTSHHNNPIDDSYMLGEHRAAAFFEPWKRKIEAIEPGDIVFLYRNGEGVVAIGQAAGAVRKRAYQGNPEHPEEEYYRNLDPFQRVFPPASAGEIKDVTGHTYSFRGTLFTMGDAEGERLLLHLTGG
jgi:hypothetical protein